MADQDLEIRHIDPTLYNQDLAPVKHENRRWGWFEIFNVWSNDIQSLFGYTLAASLFLTYGLNGWAVIAAILLAGFVIMVLVNLSGQPSVRFGIPYPVMARVSTGVRGANLPAMMRAIVAIFWYGVQTYFASTALALLINAVFVTSGGATFLGLTGVGWVSFIIVWLFQMYLFWHGMEWIRHFLNWAGPSVYAVMIALMIILWSEAGGQMLSAVGDIFSGTGTYEGGSVAAFLAITGTMIAYFAAVVINFGDFSRFVRTQRDMRIGNFLGLPLNIAFFSLIALFVTGGTLVVFGEELTNPTDIIERVDNLALTVIAAVMFFAATIGINVVANFVPPAYDLANLIPSKIDFRIGGLITSIVAFFVGALWVTVISQIGIAGFVNTLGAILAPVYGVMITDYYLVKKRQVDIQQLFSSDPGTAYYYVKGWNVKAIIAFGLGGIFSISSVWVPALNFLSGYAWVIGAILGAIFYYFLMGGGAVVSEAAARPRSAGE
ncbi:MAG: NCS1 family nucleobase:cation symporter-1 [Gammaproteobacteria bacterium]|nr:NCS1 family nucleobase:cation symporter-1 [Gammaproteobacteria bacterium]NIR90647.1 NCS1 family nucleobase:cation symporter-1 [Gammaproteobacteria bacterium]NIU07027.1 NCS1 family nucleobase:cation symporter-1 [Gammaproteobacteria bacterium]NIV53937.1 NCS1 family nucleobase:cation symporter-1 [Gammaproteobacteria bacterium]NIW86167.1 NCS1 family nucleobase:cation symporter-1 [Gammaproteobacteria bacterium]